MSDSQRDKIKELIQHLEEQRAEAKRDFELASKKSNVEKERMEKLINAEERTKQKQKIKNLQEQLQEEQIRTSIIKGKVEAHMKEMESSKLFLEENRDSLDQIETRTDEKNELAQKLTKLQAEKDKNLADKEFTLRQAEKDLLDMNERVAKAEKKLRDKQEDIAGLEKVLRLKALRSRTLEDENQDLQEQMQYWSLNLDESSVASRALEEEIVELKNIVANTREEHITLEESHSTLMRAADDLRTDSLFSKYY